MTEPIAKTPTMLVTPTLIGKHVRLEPLEAAHAGPLLAAANESRTTYAFTIVPADLAGMEAYVATALAERDAGQSLPFVVRDAAGAVVGSTRYMAIEHWKWGGGGGKVAPPAPVPAPGAPDAVEIGFTWYAERVQRTALNTEAKLLLCTHAFETWRVRRVTWKTDSRNERSRAAIARLGAQLDGVLRAHRPAADDTVRSTAFYSMLSGEWPAARKRLEAKLQDRLEVGSHRGR